MLQVRIPSLLVVTLLSAAAQTPPCTVQTIAGPSTLFSGDGGPAIQADFYNIGAFRFDNSGNLYIADTGNQRVRKMTPDGIVRTIAGTGVAGFSGDGGPATSAQLYLPVAAAADSQGNVYIVDGDNRIRKIDTAGIISTFAGNGIANFAGDGGPATEAEFQEPNDVIADSNGNVFIADTFNSRVREVNPQGIISTFAGSGSSLTGLSQTGLGGPALTYALAYPESLALDSAGNLYIADGSLVLKVDNKGIITNYAGGGTASSTSPVGQQPTAAYFSSQSISIDPNGNLAIAGNNNGVYNVSPSGVISQISSTYSFRIAFNGSVLYQLFGNTIFLAGSNVMLAGAFENGTSGDGGPATQATFLNPGPLAIDSQHNIYVVDSYAGVVRKIAPDGTITHFAGNVSGSSLPGDGSPAAQANIGYTLGITVDSQDNVYLADVTASSVFKINTQGLISTIISGQLLFPPAINMAVDPNGNIYLQEYNGVYEFNAAGQEQGFHSIPNLSEASAWTFDSAGDMYWLSAGTLNKLATNGTTTALSIPQFSKNLSYPNEYGLAVDGSGNVYISNVINYFYRPTALIQEVTPDGRIFTLARQNTALPYTDGPPGQVDLGYFTSLISDPSGNLYFAAPYTFGVRELTAGCPATVHPIIAANAVVNAASYSPAAAPGQISAVFGLNLGPAAGQVVPVTSNQFPADYGGVSITVNGFPAPLLYVSQSQVNFVIPFEISGQNQCCTVQMSYNGVASDAYNIGSGLADPGIFVVANPDGSVNSVSNPAKAGSYVVIYGTGQGVSNPLETDGEIMGNSLAMPLLAVTVSLDGQTESVLYAGSTPGLVAGVLQVNLALPATLTAGQHTLSIAAGSSSSPTTHIFTQ